MVKNPLLKIRNYLSYLLAIIFIAAIFTFFIDFEDLEQLRKIKPMYIPAIAFVLYILVLIDSVEYNYLLNRVQKTSLDLLDFLTFPLSVNMWSYILPIQGSLIYTTLLFKYKYKAVASKSLSVSISSYLISFWVSGLIGLLIYLRSPEFGISLLIISLILILMPFGLLFNKLLSRIKPLGIPIISTFFNFGLNVSRQIGDVFYSYKALIYLGIVHFVHILVSCCMYYLVTLALHLDIPVQVVLVYTILIRLSQVIKLTPGNLGWNELLSGGIFALYGFEPSVGLAISLTRVGVQLLLTGSIGLFATVYNTRHFNFSSKLAEFINGKKKSSK